MICLLTGDYSNINLQEGEHDKVSFETKLLVDYEPLQADDLSGLRTPKYDILNPVLLLADPSVWVWHPYRFKDRASIDVVLAQLLHLLVVRLLPFGGLAECLVRSKVRFLYQGFNDPVFVERLSEVLTSRHLGD